MKPAVRRRRWIWIVAGLIVVAAIALFAAPRLMEYLGEPEEAQEGDVVVAFVGDLSSNATASGTLEAQQEADLALNASGRVQQVFVEAGDEIRAGDLLVQLDTEALERAVRSAEQSVVVQEANLAALLDEPSEADLDAAEANIVSAQAQLDDLLEGPNKEEIDAAESELRAAKANVWAASEELDETLAGASEADIAAAQANLFSAQIEQEAIADTYETIIDLCFTFPDGTEICPLYGPVEEETRANLEAADQALVAARAQYDLLVDDPDPDLVAIAQANLAVAVAQQEAAQAQLDLLQRDPSTAEIAALKAQLAQAQASLASLKREATEEELEIAQAQLEQARIGLEKAENDLAQAALEAPFDGVVTDVHVTEGELASGPAVTLLSKESLEVVLDVDEVDIGSIQVGQEAVITLEAWPDTELQASVLSIAPKSSLGGDDVVTFQVRLGLEAGELPARAGMTANANLVKAKRENVLLVPNRAVIADRESGKYYVNRVSDGGLNQVEVVIGLRDRRNTEIVDGLEEGDRLLIGSYEMGFDFGEGPPSAIREMYQ